MTYFCTGKNTYHSFEDIPINEYIDIYKINIPIESSKNNAFISKIFDFTNLQSLYFMDEKRYQYEYTNVIDFLPNKIACFQKLSSVGGIFCTTHEQYKMYIYEDKMLLVIGNMTSNKFPNIPSYIKYLNIYRENNIHTQVDFINFPSTLEYIHLQTRSIETFQQTNLPSNLKSLSITIIQLIAYFENEIIHIVNFNCKIPHDCEIKIITT